MSHVAKYLSAAAVGIGTLLAGGAARAGDIRPVPVVAAAPVVEFARPGWPGYRPPVHCHDYAVYVRSGGHHHWRYYGTYETRGQAERVEHRLRHAGYLARVVPVGERPYFPGW